MNMKQAGFTLIELVMVIVILGILAAVAIPKYVDLSNDAKSAKASGVAGAVASSAAIQYAAAAASSSLSYSTTTACNGGYLNPANLPSSCSSSLSTNSCTIGCDGVSATAVTLP